MLEVRETAVIHRDRQTVYQALREMEHFPSFLKDVKEIFIRGAEDNKVVSDWKVDIDGTPIEWRQETLFDDTNHEIIRFRMLEGDYEKYEGEWLLEPQGAHATKVNIRAIFEWGVPGLERFVGHIFDDKARTSLRRMLYAIRRELHQR